MRLHLFLITLSSCAWAFVGWYGYHLNPKARLNRSCAAWGLFVSAWSFIVLLFVGRVEGNWAAAWYSGEKFSYLPKPVLFLHFVLYLTGYRKKMPTAALAILYIIAGATAALGICYFASLPIGVRAHELLSYAGPGASPLRAVYAVLAIGLYSCSGLLIVLWHLNTKLRREKRMSLYYLALLVLVVAANTLISLLKTWLGPLQIDLLILLQAAQAFPSVLAIEHYKSLRPVDTILSEQLRSQLSFSVTVVDHEGRIVSANAATEELAGSGSERLVGQPYQTLLAEDGLAPPLLGASCVRFYELDFRSQGGGSIPMSLSVTPIRDDWGDCAGYVLIGQPVKGLSERQIDLGLSNREREVCLLLMQGLSNQEIAERLFISPGTVKNHVYNIYEKTQVKNRVELSRLFS